MLQRREDMAFALPASRPALRLPSQRRKTLSAQENFEREVVAFFYNAARVLSVPKSVAVIYGAIFASPRPVCFSDVEEKLAISKGSISQGLRILRQVGAVKLVEVPGDRREFFVPDLALRKLFLSFLEHRLQPQLNESRARLAALARTVKSIAPREQQILSERLSALQVWNKKAGALLPVVKAFLSFPKP